MVLTKNANVGDTITPFSSALDTKGAVVTMADMSTLEVEADVSESNLEKVHVEQPCVIELDALPSVRFEGYVSRTVPTVDRTKATVMTKIRFRELDPRILPDMSAKVAFLSRPLRRGAREPRPAVDAQAVVTRDGRQVVFVVRDGKTYAPRCEPGSGWATSSSWWKGPSPARRWCCGHPRSSATALRSSRREDSLEAPTPTRVEPAPWRARPSSRSAI